MQARAATQRLIARILVLTAVGAALGAPVPTLAQPNFHAAGAVAERSASGVLRPTHGWLAIPDASSAVLAHIPPRREGDWADGRSHGVPDGTLRKAMPLDSMPSAIAAIEDRVYLIFEQRTVAGEMVRRSVSSLVAHPSAIGDFWYFEPEGRMYSHPALAPTGILRALAGTPIGLAAMIDDGPGAGPASRLRVLVLDRDRWSDVVLPTGLVTDRTFLFGTRQGLALLSVSLGGDADLWIGSLQPATSPKAPPVPKAPANNRPRQPFEDDDGPILSREPTPDRGPLVLDWRRSTACGDGSLRSLDLSRTEFVSAGGVLTAVTGEPGGSVVLRTVTPASAYQIVRVEGVGSQAATVWLDVPGRLVLTWMAVDEEPSPARPGTPPGHVRSHPEVREVSVYTGRILYSGHGQGDAPVSPRELQLLAAGLVGLMTVVLLLVLRREPDDGVYHLPEGTALAEPGRRLMASCIDLGLALAVASKLWGVDMSETLMPAGFVSGQSLWVLGTATGLGLCIGTLCEWLTGRTPGKLLAGCEVIDARTGAPELRHPRLWQSLVRNAVKWLVPPVAAVGLMEIRRRHRGDSFARSAVVIRVYEEEPEDSDEAE